MIVRNLLLLARPKHYIKNLLVVLPLFFSGLLFNVDDVKKAALGFLAFSLAASVVYIINDIKDVHKDRLHPTKKRRPIAAGKVSPLAATLFATALLILSLLINWYIAGNNIFSWGLLVGYIIINIAYSSGLKNIPVLDVFILSLGFIIRVLYGAEIISVTVSKWLLLTIFALSFYMGLGKRRNEITINGHVARGVNRHYTSAFLDKNMYVCLAISIIFYSLWAIDPAQSQHMTWTIPLIILIFMTYSLNIERDTSSGDPTEVVLGNKLLLALVCTYALIVTFILYTL